MPIATAVRRGGQVYVYNERNQQLFSKSAGSRPEEGLKGYTSGAVSIRLGNTICTYNEKGQLIGTQSA